MVRFGGAFLTRILLCVGWNIDDPTEIEDLSEDERGGASPPELVQLEVQVLERKRAVGEGLVKTGTAQSRLL